MKQCNLLNFERDIHTVPVDWLWYPYISLGNITIIQGDPSCGKTMFSSYLLSQLSKGYDLNNPDEIGEPIVSLFFSAEDSLSNTIKPRLEMHNADCNHIYSIDDASSPLTMKDERIEEALIRTNAKVIVLDPIQAYLGPQVDMHRANEVRPVLKHLGSLAERYNCAIILIGHMNKGSGKALYRSVGSIDFIACARSVLTIGKVKDEQDIRVILHTKSSLAPAGATLAFSINREKGFEWIGEYDISEDDLLAGGTGSSKLSSAIELIESLTQNEPVATNKIMAEAKLKGIGKTTMNAAKEKLNIKSMRMNDMWYWSK